LTSHAALSIDPRLPAESQVYLGRQITWVEAIVTANIEYVVTTEATVPAAGGKPKGGLIVFEFLDQEGDIVQPGAHLHKGRHGHFLYLEPAESGLCEHRFSVPDRAISVRIGLALWRASAEELRVVNRLELRMAAQDPLELEAGLTRPEATRGLIDLSGTQNPDVRLKLTADPVWTTFRAKPGMDLRLTFDVLGEVSEQEKAAVVWLAFYDRRGHQLRSRAPISSGKNGEYVYLDVRESGPAGVNVFTPQDCAAIKMGLATWKAKTGSLSVLAQVEVIDLTSHAGSVTAAATAVGDHGRPLAIDGSLSHDSYLPLRTEPSWLDLEISEPQEYRIGITVDGEENALMLKSGLMRVQFHGAVGERLVGTGLKVSQLLGEYIYIDAIEPGTYQYDLHLPEGCRRLRLGFQAWDAPSNGLRIRNSVSIRRKARVQKPKAIQAPAQPGGEPSAASLKPRRAHELKVAVVCDEFTFNSFKYEFRPVILEPDSWREALEYHQPDIFLCESAWSGVDSDLRPWKGQIYASINFEKENRHKLLEILEYCRDNRIPTIFWNKEDPSHYEDRVHDFVKTAALFDYVFTTDQDCVERYKNDHGIERIACLPFATQPRLFNPSEAGVRTSDVVFAGSWYANHEDRSEDMAAIFDSILDAGLNLDIYDRYFGTSDELHVFPERFMSYTRPPVSHAQLAKVYKSSLFGLNINTVTDSSTMFARRVFELMSSNTVVISNYARGLAELFGDNVVTLHEDSRALSELEDSDVERMRDENLHHVLGKHTYAHRFRFILDTIGFRYQPEDDRLALVCVVSSPDEIRALISKYRYYTDVASKMVLVIDESVPDSEVRRYYSEFNRLGTTVVSRSLWRKQGISAESVVGVSNFALVDIRDFPSKDVLRKAALHLGYVDGPVVFGSTEKYIFETRGVLKNIVAPSWYLDTAVIHAGEETSGSFYHV
jgi:spore maturation protein CgeB